MNRLVKLGVEALKPRKHYDGIQWLAPIVSRRQANVLRKRALREGSYGTIGKNPGIVCASGFTSLTCELLCFQRVLVACDSQPDNLKICALSRGHDGCSTR